MSYAKNYLTMDKIDTLLDAMEHPERYTDDELEALLADPEAAQALSAIDKTMSALAPVSTPDVDAQWQVFQRSQAKRKPLILRLLPRRAAASIAIAAAALAAVAAVVGTIHYVSASRPEPQAEEIVKSAEEITAAPAADSDSAAAMPGIVVCDNEPLMVIIKRIADYYGYEVQLGPDAPADLRLYFRWDQRQSLEDVVESLNNFQQIHIVVADRTLRVD